jgi:antitoxin component HigA of HigAB toxin-antitoxin module
MTILYQKGFCLWCGKKCKTKYHKKCLKFEEQNMPDPIEAIKFRMEQQGLSQADLMRAGCGNRSHISEMLNRKRKINLKFIRAYYKIADTTPLKVLIQDYKL